MSFNEMYQGDEVRIPYARLADWMAAMPAALRVQKQAEAGALFRRIGITFAVDGEGGDPDRRIPFDMFPRVFTAMEWARLERGIKQRARAAFRRRWPIRTGPVKRPWSASCRPRGLFPHRRHRHRAHRTHGFLCVRGQLPHPVGCQLHAGKPRNDDADVP